MPSESKPSGARDTGFLSGPFHQARIRLTLVYVAILAVILLLSSSSIYKLFSSRLEFRFARFQARGPMIISAEIVPPDPEQVREDLINAFLIVDGLLLLAGGFASYWFAEVTLQPIQDMYHRQRRFLSDASHELRTPLSILQTDLENELSDETRQGASRKQAESHLEEVERMSRIVADLLVLSRLDEPLVTRYRSETLRLSDVVEEAVDRLHAIAERQQVALHLSGLETPIRVSANRDLLVQALRNIVKNAIAYNTEHGSVAIHVSQEGKQAVIRVTDTGIGIAKTDLEKIFDRFYRSDESRTRQTGGSGLGLAIVQSIVKQMHGSVQIESELGKGTVVTLRLPALRSS